MMRFYLNWEMNPFQKVQLKLWAISLDCLRAEHPGLDQLSAIIDAGAFFKNFKTRRFAEAILQLFKGSKEVVLFYDETSNQLEFIRGVFDSATLISITTGRPETTDSADIYKATGTAIENRFILRSEAHYWLRYSSTQSSPCDLDSRTTCIVAWYPSRHFTDAPVHDFTTGTLSCNWVCAQILLQQD